MNLHFLGGAMEIGGSCIYIRIMDKGILLDSGIRQSNAKDPLPDFCTIQEQGGLDAVIVSHAHMDHIGTLPIISREFPSARIYMTAMTADLTRVLLYDSLKIMSGWEDEIPHYSQQDVLAMLNRIYPIGYQAPFPIFDNFTLTFYPAGHIAGAACVYLVTEEGSLFYSGDFSAFAQRTIEGIRIPKLRPDAAIVETTYGNRLHANRQVEEKRLIELAGECILQKKKILIPAFALGRAQEVLLILRAAIQNQEIPPVPVYVDGMVRGINAMYTRNPVYLKNALGKRILKGNEPFYTKEIQPVAAAREREELLNGSEPVIFLSSSGMLTGGPSALYASKLAPSENACIIITGYQDEESPGRQLLNLLDGAKERSLTINGVTVPVRCRIEQVGLSAHGDKSEILGLLERLSPRRIFLVHGNRDVISGLGKELAAADFRRQVYLPECGQSYEIFFRNKRTQILFQPSHVMGMGRAFTPEDEKLLWEYWQKHYFGKAFSVPQIAQIWYGKPVEAVFAPEEQTRVLQAVQEILYSGCYFTPNHRRLFLFQAKTAEEAALALAPKELTVQELDAQVEAFFSAFPYRKISYYNGQRKILLQFDYPDSQNQEEFGRAAAAFADAAGWTVEINPAMNHSAAAFLLSSLFGGRLAKTSYYIEKKYYLVTLSGQQPADTDADAQAARKFREETGWNLVINGQSRGDTLSGDGGSNADGGCGGDNHEDFFSPASADGKPMEQNQAFQYIDQIFQELPHRPDKKSLKNDVRGKYLEVSFISPVIGRKYRRQLQALSNQTGWRIHIADKVNQSELFKRAQLLCMKYGVVLRKNPSYLPESRSIQLKPQMTENAGAWQKIAEEFQETTGCACMFSSS